MKISYQNKNKPDEMLTKTKFDLFIFFSCKIMFYN
jgi:hypothetical protein